MCFRACCCTTQPQVQAYKPAVQNTVLNRPLDQKMEATLPTSSPPPVRQAWSNTALPTTNTQPKITYETSKSVQETPVLSPLPASNDTIQPTVSSAIPVNSPHFLVVSLSLSASQSVSHSKPLPFIPENDQI